MVEGLEFNETREKGAPSMRYDGSEQHVNRNLVDPEPVENDSTRPEDMDPHDETPEYGRWVWTEAGDGYDVGEIADPDAASWEDVMEAFGAVMGEEDEQYMTDGGTMVDVDHGAEYDSPQASMERGYGGIPVGGMPSPVAEEEVDEDMVYMGDFPM